MPDPIPNEKIASIAWRIYVALVMPLMSGATLAVSQMADVQGYYAGITYHTASVVSPTTADWYIIYRHRARR